VEFSPRLVLGAILALVLACAALLARVGSDAQWLAALGRVILNRHAIPQGVPFASAPTGHWPNALVLAELIFAELENVLGDRGLMLAQLIAVAGGMAILVTDARAQGADESGIAGALVLVGLGALPSLAIVRVQLFSLLLFPALAALLRSQARSPSRAIWWAVPLLALWSNLHGAALLGAGMVIVYLVFARARREPWLAAGVGLASLLALCLTPAGIRTVSYYGGVLTNLAAQRGEGMWGPLSLSAPLDLLLALCVLLLGHRARRARPPLWEWAMIAVLAVGTVKADRDGVWLLFFLAVPAARALEPVRIMRAAAPVALAAAVAILGVSLVRGPVPSQASRTLVRGAIAAAHGSPVLADGSTDEEVALDGGRIWAGNPIDAFSRSVQAAYLDWLAGSPSGQTALVPSVRVVLVAQGSQTQALMARMPDFTLARSQGGELMYERVN
jgi:hypothetical protein